LFKFLLDRGLIYKHQQAFMFRFSTNNNLLECTFDWFIALAHSDYVDIIYINLYKAFDNVAFCQLFFKLSSLGITDKRAAIKNGFFQRQFCYHWCAPKLSLIGPVLFLVL